MQGPSRSVGKLADILRNDILGGSVSVGQLMASERQLAREQGVSTKTVRGALKLLESEGLVAAEERRGYRVLSTTGRGKGDRPIAFVVSSAVDQNEEEFHRGILHELQASAAKHHWPLLGIIQDARTPAELLAAISTSRVWGTVVDRSEPGVLDALRKEKVPTVLAESWSEVTDFDEVAQDSFGGGFLAGSWLGERGHKRVAFIGHSIGKTSRQAFERFGGASAGLACHGAWIPREWLIAEANLNTQAAYEKARELLALPDRPRAVLALWQGLAQSVARAAGELGLVLGQDLDIVGWSSEESYASDYASGFRSTPVPPTITWSIGILAERCIERLIEREADPNRPTTVIKVPTRLRAQESGRRAGPPARVQRSTLETAEHRGR